MKHFEHVQPDPIAINLLIISLLFSPIATLNILVQILLKADADV